MKSPSSKLCATIAGGWLVSLLASHGQLFSNLQSHSQRAKVGDPAVPSVRREGPKGIATADFNLDGHADLAVSNLDGTVTLLLGTGTGSMAAPIHLQTGAKTLRAVIAADLNGDGKMDIAAAGPADSKVYIFFSNNGSFGSATPLATWFGGRDLTDGDFDGDGIRDLLVAGPGLGAKYYRGTGGGGFASMGRVTGFPANGYAWDLNFKPVHALKTVRSVDGSRDEVLAAGEWGPSIYTLSTQALVAPIGGAYQDPLSQKVPEGAAVDTPLIISEFMASNGSGLVDEDGEHSDWLEIYNRSSSPVNLTGWTLRDGTVTQLPWVFPSVTIESGEFLVIFASEKNRRIVGQPLHTDFKLSAAGEYLALFKPDKTLAHEYGPMSQYSFSSTVYPSRNGEYTYYAPQYDDLSYGVTQGGEFAHMNLPTPGSGNNGPGLSSVGWYYADGYGWTVDQWRNKDYVSSMVATPPAPASGDVVQITLTPKASAPAFTYVRCYANDSRYAGLSVSNGGVMTRQPNGSYTCSFTADSSAKYLGYYCYAIRPVTYTYGNTSYTYDHWEWLASETLRMNHPPASSASMQAIASVAVGTYYADDYRYDHDGPDYQYHYFYRYAYWGQGTPAFAMGPLLGPISGGTQDCALVNRSGGYVEIRAGTNDARHIAGSPGQRIEIEGEPRELAIADLDGDGWNDLIVVLRNVDRVVTLKNHQGTFRLTSEIPVGSSPRDIVVADLDENGSPDAAVINRYSSDVSLLTTYPGSAGFAKLDSVYPTGADVSGLLVADFNGDGLGDVLELHRSSGDAGVRYAKAGGALETPVFYDLGERPSQVQYRDITGDGIRDLVAANMGQWGWSYGYLIIRPGLAGGGFGPIRKLEPPNGWRGAYYSVSVADLDGDGDADMVTGYADCRLAFWENTGQGSFVFRWGTFFAYECRAISAAADFDQDGDIDVAGASYDGKLVVFENTGNLLIPENYIRHEYLIPGNYGASMIWAQDVNGDGDPDLMMGGYGGMRIFLGSTGATFEVDLSLVAGGLATADSLVVGDFDGDGQKDDVATSCKVLSCLNILTKDANGVFNPAITVDVPAGLYLAAGDIDGDGFDDLVGTGDTLWVALSSKRPELRQYAAESNTRSVLAGMVINEVLARNNEIPVEGAGGAKPDFVELYNSTNITQNVGGWKLELSSTDDAGAPLIQSYTLPAATMAAKKYLLIYFDERVQSWWTNFKIPSTGGTLRLLAQNGTVVDTVTFAEQQENVSYARFQDGHQSFVFNSAPSPGRSNADNGPLEPEATLLPLNFDAVRIGQPLRFTARAKDDAGVVGLYIVWRTKVPVGTQRTTFLYDDGQHDDGGVLDGLFAGQLPSLAAGTEIEYYMVCQDLSGRSITLPEDGQLGVTGDQSAAYTFGLATPSQAQAQISEVVADSKTGPTDESQGTPDYVEIQNKGTTELNLTGWALAKSLTATPAERFLFPSGTTVKAGEYVIVYCDADTAQGPMHAPFKIESLGDTLMLLRPTTSGGFVLADGVTTSSLKPDEAWQRLPDGSGGLTGKWSAGKLSARLPNGTPGSAGLTKSSGSTQTYFTHTFATQAGATYTPQRSTDLIDWTNLSSVVGDGFPKAVSVPLESKCYLRVRKN